MNNKTLIGAGLLLLLIGYAGGRYAQPAKIVTKTEVVTQIKTVVEDHVHTVTVTKELPNGEKDTTTTTDNNSVIKDKTNTKNDSSTVTTYNKPQWRVQALAGLNASNFTNPIYGAGIERRIIGPIAAGAWGTTNHEGGISLSLEF
jgi:hypothetical protein